MHMIIFVAIFWIEISIFLISVSILLPSTNNIIHGPLSLAINWEKQKPHMNIEHSSGMNVNHLSQQNDVSVQIKHYYYNEI